MKFVLDTATVSLLARGDAATARRLAAHPVADVAMSAVTALELHYGLARNPTTRVRDVVLELMRTITVVPLTEDVGRAYGEIRTHLERRGRPIGPHDLMIAAHARTLACTIVTPNVREFRRVPGLACEDWSAP